MAFITNKAVARTISIAAGIAALAAGWQAVRFCQGEVGAPGLDQFLAALQSALGSSAPEADAGPITWLFGGLQKVLYYLGGVGVWLGFGVLLASLGNSVARIVEVGFEQYMAECKAAEEERQRLAKLAAEREQRRELRRKRLEAAQPKSSFSFGALLLGIVIGRIL